MLQSKPWMTSSTWSPSICIVTQDQVNDIDDVWPPLIHPEWDSSFASSAISWIGKLKSLLDAAGRESSGLDSCRDILQHTSPDYMPSGRTLTDKIAALRRGSRPEAFTATSQVGLGIDAVAGATFQGAHRGACITLASTAPPDGQLGFCDEPLADGMYCIFRSTLATSHFSAAQCPVRLGRVMRVVAEAASPYAVVEGHWPIVKPDKFPGRANLFGTWLPGTSPTIMPPPSKRPKQDRGLIDVPLDTVVLWPIETEPGKEQGVRIPMEVFHNLRASHDMNLSSPSFAFARRGKAFFMACSKERARWIWEQQSGNPH